MATQIVESDHPKISSGTYNLAIMDDIVDRDWRKLNLATTLTKNATIVMVC